MVSKNIKICLVDDEDILRITTYDDLKDNGYDVNQFANPLDALDSFNTTNYDVLITDLKMPDMDGISLMQKAKEINKGLYIIVMTAFASVESAVKALKLGAFDYLIKPFDLAELLKSLETINEISSLKKYNKEYKTLFRNQYNIYSYWGESEVVKKLRENVKLVAETDTSVLITGETGTGKELMANIIHYTSNRAQKPLVKVSCAILSKDIFESELFGHEKGAFTGADKQRIGRFEEANNGSIYLDDIDDVPLDMQVKLLRVLQEGEIERLGSNKPVKVDVRVIASTKVDLKELVKQGKFREDLYYRLNIFPLNLPPLRKRTEDIPVLFNKFLNEYSKGKKYEIDTKTMRYIINYPWPGNTRQMKNLVERLILLAKDNVISSNLLPNDFLEPSNNFSQDGKSLTEKLEAFEISLINNAMEEAEGNKSKAAKILQIPLTTLRSKLEKYNLL